MKDRISLSSPKRSVTGSILASLDPDAAYILQYSVLSSGKVNRSSRSSGSPHTVPAVSAVAVPVK